MHEHHIIVAFDTSTPNCVVAVGRKTPNDARLLWSEERIDGANQASSQLVPRIRHVLQSAGFAWPDVTDIACGRGPGTFTGTRVCVATAKGLALAAAVPLVPIDTLAALAASAGVTGTVWAMLDARRGEVYAGRYRCEWSEDAGLVEITVVDAPRCIAVRELLADAEAQACDAAIGPGLMAYAHDVPASMRTKVVPAPGLSAKGLWHAAVAAVHAGEAKDPALVDASYLRQSYAELGLNRPKRPMTRSPWI